MNRLFRGTTLVALLLAVAVMLAACGGGDGGRGRMTNIETAPVRLSGDAAQGQRVYASTCVHCHGENATGMPNLGKDLTASEFVAGQTDKELIDFIKTNPE